jgi:hypothetical protein
MLCLRGISTKYFEPAVAEFFGSEAGLSASTIQQLTREWSQELGRVADGTITPNIHAHCKSASYSPVSTCSRPATSMPNCA